VAGEARAGAPLSGGPRRGAGELSRDAPGEGAWDPALCSRGCPGAGDPDAAVPAAGREVECGVALLFLRALSSLCRLAPAPPGLPGALRAQQPG
jgi:hypothetical protein